MHNYSEEREEEMKKDDTDRTYETSLMDRLFLLVEDLELRWLELPNTNTLSKLLISIYSTVGSGGSLVLPAWTLTGDRYSGQDTLHMLYKPTWTP